jgi:hypothetical protein
MKIAIIGCKKQKQNYACSADEMYSKAFTYTIQRDFIKQAYDDFYIFSSKYGIIHHTTTIEPYNITLQQTGTKYQVFANSDPFDAVFVKQNVDEFVSNNVYNELHFHVTRAYMSYVKPFVKTQVIQHITQMQNTGMIKERYTEALQKWNGNLDESLKIIQTPIPKNPESPHIWIHPELGEFNGTSYHLWKTYKDKQPKLDQAMLRKVGFSRLNHHKQWRLKCK